MTEGVVIAGRGPSLSPGLLPPGWDVCAVSSAIFALPKLATMVATVDVPRHYMPEATWADWQKAGLSWWPFHAADRVIKHVPRVKWRRSCFYRLPRDFYDRMPESLAGILRQVAGDDPTQYFGDEGWGDCPGSKGWATSVRAPMTFGRRGTIGLGLMNSLAFAVQLVARLGYRRVRFVGVDRRDAAFDAVVSARQDAEAAGIEWEGVGEMGKALKRRAAA